MQVVFGNDAPAEMHAAWASAAPAAAAGATAASAANAPAGAATDGGATAGAGSGKQEAAETPAEAVLVARLVAALRWARFDAGDVKGVALAGQWKVSLVHRALPFTMLVVGFG